MTYEASELGKKSSYEALYNPDKLFPMPRQPKRLEIGINGSLPFYGYDIWNHYEVSWLNEKGKPIVALAEIIINCESTYIIESKSLKLYFNTFNNSSFKDAASVANIVKKDICERIGTEDITVNIIPVAEYKHLTLLNRLEGINLDNLDITCADYNTQTAHLTTENTLAEETLYSDLLKSNCLVTNQPDWCSVQITYKGKKINHEGLLRYLVSFRNDNEFHEQCIEKIFMHLMQYCKPQELSVYGRSTRRGGLDINSCRSTQPMKNKLNNVRLCRQ